MPIKDRKVFIRKHNDEQTKRNESLYKKTSSSAEAINNAAKATQAKIKKGIENMA